MPINSYIENISKRHTLRNATELTLIPVNGRIVFVIDGRLLQFNKEKRLNMYQEEVMVPMGDWAKSRLRNLRETDKVRDPSKVGSGFGKNISNWLICR